MNVYPEYNSFEPHVAEGVESQDVLDRMRQYRCEFAQGYFICWPLERSALRGWLVEPPDILDCSGFRSSRKAKAAIRGKDNSGEIRESGAEQDCIGATH